MPKKYILIISIITILSILISFFIYWLFQKQEKNKSALEKYPHVILIVVDTLRSDHLSSLGYDKNTTPFLDSFAKESIFFPNVIANGSWTVPNIGTILTGLHPSQHQMEKDNIPKKNFLWLGELLQNENFTTAAFSANQKISTKYKFQEGFSKYYFYSGKDELAFPDISEITAKANEWLATRSKNQPFFLYMQSMNIHGPYKSSRPAKEKFLDQTAGTFNYYDATMNNIMRENKTSDRANVTSEYVQDLKNQYDAAIFYSDQQLAMFIADLKQKQLYDNSLIIIMADHGEELYDHQGFSHGYSMYQEILKTPVLIKPPQTASQEIKNMVGNKYADLREQIDILPAITALLNIKTPNGLPGQNMLAKNYQRKPINIKADWKYRCIGQAVIDWPYKLIYTKFDYQQKKDAYELYDLSRDAEEKNDLSDKLPDIKEMLLTKLLID